MAYESTTVPVERSQGQIRRLLTDHGASRLAFGEERDDQGRQWAGLSFVVNGQAVRMQVPLRPLDEREVRRKAMRARVKTVDDIREELYEQEERRVWRVLAWNLKARLVAVEEELETFEEAFLAHLLDPRSGRTFYEELSATGQLELPKPLPSLGPGHE